MNVRTFLLAALVALTALGACHSAPEQKIEKVEGNIVFRLGGKSDGFEIRLESSFYPTSGYELVTHTEGTAAAITEGVTVVLEGVRVPLEPAGPRAPASAVIDWKVGQPIDGITFPLVFKIPTGEGTAQLDAYTVQHTARGWRISRDQGGFSRFERQGSY